MSTEDVRKAGNGPQAAGGSQPADPSSPRPSASDPNVPAWAAAQHPDLKPGAAPRPPVAAPAAAAPAPAKPPAAKPAATAMERREFINWLSLGWIAFSAASAAGLTALGRFFFPNVLFEPPSVFKVGFPEDFADGVVDERFKDKYRVWLVRDGNIIYCLFAQCTHLGCTPNWLPQENKFKCPCHGSGYYRSGVNFEGPAPRPLERCKITLADDGQIQIDKNVRFAQEKGQWSDPLSFLTV
jgi:cytochrome b6-f complex iron-sulfur subunit